MESRSYNIPILFIVFNRPEPTRVVFNRIKEIQPNKLFIASDGPRENVLEDIEKNEEVRKIATAVDWQCEVQTLFQENNLGCGLAPYSAISWFFDNIEEGIILEDDCLPCYSFFGYCQELLDFYRYEPRVMHISGNNFQYGRKRGRYSYYFSRYSHNWGWATWRRAWKYYDFSLMPQEYREHSWDKQWELSIEKQGGVSILPNQNLVKNIGFGEDATHTKTIERYSFIETKEMIFPINHPKKISINEFADRYTEYTHFRSISNPYLIILLQFRDLIRPIIRSIKNTVSRFFPHFVYLYKLVKTRSADKKR